jgi:hypothetical protein
MKNPDAPAVAIGFGIVVAIGLIWSVAAISKLVPVPIQD